MPADALENSELYCLPGGGGGGGGCRAAEANIPNTEQSQYGNQTLVKSEKIVTTLV